MTSHIHLIIGSNKESITKTLFEDLKRYTSETLHKAIVQNKTESRREWMIKMMQEQGIKNSNNSTFQLWQQNNHPIELTTDKILYQKLNYLHLNPVVSGFVEKPEDWLYSSARDYCGKKGLLKIILIEPEVISIK